MTHGNPLHGQSYIRQWIGWTVGYEWLCREDIGKLDSPTYPIRDSGIDGQ